MRTRWIPPDAAIRVELKSSLGRLAALTEEMAGHNERGWTPGQLRDVRELRELTKEIERLTVAIARADHSFGAPSWAYIGEQLGMSRQAAWEAHRVRQA